MFKFLTEIKKSPSIYLYLRNIYAKKKVCFIYSHVCLLGPAGTEKYKKKEKIISLIIKWIFIKIGELQVVNPIQKIHTVKSYNCSAITVVMLPERKLPESFKPSGEARTFADETPWILT